VGVTDGVPWQVRAYVLTYVGVEGRGRSDRQEAKEVVRQRGRKRGEMREEGAYVRTYVRTYVHTYVCGGQGRVQLRGSWCHFVGVSGRLRSTGRGRGRPFKPSDRFQAFCSRCIPDLKCTQSSVAVSALVNLRMWPARSSCLRRSRHFARGCQPDVAWTAWRVRMPRPPRTGLAG